MAIGTHKMFEFNRSFKQQIKQFEHEELWTQIDRLLVEYLQTKQCDLLLAIEFLLLHSSRVGEDEHEDIRRKRFRDIWQRLWHASASPHLDNRWLLIHVLRSLHVDPESLESVYISELDLQLSLKQNGLPAEWLSMTQLEKPEATKKLLVQLKKLLNTQPHLAQTLIEQLLQVLQFRPTSNKQTRSDLEQLARHQLNDLLNQERDLVERQTMTADFNTICDLLNIVSDKHLLHPSFEFGLNQLAAQCNLLESHKYSHLMERYYSAIIARQTPLFAQKMCELRWKMEQSLNDETKCVLLQENGSQLNTLNCIRAATIDRKHFLLQLMDCDVQVYKSLPIALRLPYLIHQSHLASECENVDHFEIRFEKLRNIILKEFRNEEMTYYEKLGSSFVTIISRLKWIFSFLGWCSIKFDPFASSLRQKMLHDLIQDRSVIQVMKDHDLLNRLTESGYCFYGDLLTAIEDSGDQGSMMILRAYACVCLCILWIARATRSTSSQSNTNGFPSVEPETETYAEMIEKFVNQIQPLTLRIEVLENMFSLLFLNENDLREEEEETANADMCSEMGMNEVAEEPSEIDIGSIGSKDTNATAASNNTTTLPTTNTQDLRQLFGLSPTAKHLLKRPTTSPTCSSSLFFHTIDTFIFPNELVNEFIQLLKHCIQLTRTELFTQTRKLEEEEMLERPNVHHISSSIANLQECRTRSKELLDHLNAAEWRYSVVIPAFNFGSDSRSIAINQKSTDHIMDLENDLGAESRKPSLNATENWSFRFMRKFSLADSQELVSSTELNSYPSSSCPQQTINCKQVRHASDHVLHSIISCMLASFDQLLRYCLIENQLDKAQQVLQLFHQQLKGTREAVELVVISKCQQLSNTIHALRSNNTRRMSTISTANLSSSDAHLKTQLQSVLHNFMLEMEQIQQGFDFNLLLNDFALCSAPTHELSKFILDINKQNALAVQLDERSSDFLQQYMNFVDIYYEYEWTRSLSPYETLLSTWWLVNFTNPKKALYDAEQRVNFRHSLIQVKQFLEQDLEESDNASRRSSTRSINPKQLFLQYQMLVNCCSGSAYNYLRVLFSYVRKVSKALDECRKRSESISSVDQIENRSAYDKLILRADSSSYFSVLYKSPSAILYSLVVQHGISPHHVDDLAKQMKVDLLNTLCSDLLPPIPATFDQEDIYNEFSVHTRTHPALCRLITAHLTSSNNSESLMIQDHFDAESEEEQPENSEHQVKCEIIQTAELIEYFKLKSNLLVITLRLMNLIDLEVITSDNLDLDFIPDSPLMQWINLVQQWFGNPSGFFKRDLTILALFPCLPASNFTVLRYLEKLALGSNWEQIYRTLSRLYLPSSPVNAGFNSFRTALLYRLGMDTGDVKYALQIESPTTRAKLILDIVNSSSSELYSNAQLAVQDLNSLLASINLDAARLNRLNRQERMEQLGSSIEQQELQLQTIRKRIEIVIRKVNCYSQIAQLAGLRTWKEAIDNLSEIDILMILKTRRMYRLVIEWNAIRQEIRLEESEAQYLDQIQITEEEVEIQKEVDNLRRELLATAFCEQRDLTALKDLFQTCPAELLQVLEKIYHTIDNLDSKQFLTQTILQLKDERADFSNIEMYRNNLIGVQMLRFMSQEHRYVYQSLISRPRLLIEQMFMNSEFEALEKCLTLPDLIGIVEAQWADVQQWRRDQWSLDRVVEWFARKAVDIQVPLEQASIASSDATMLSANLSRDLVVYPDPKFVMPSKPPTRDQWIPDKKIRICMSCGLNRFSMFHRKHHCRRCGRVVCKPCSNQFVIIAQIDPNRSVRICDQCFTASFGSSNSTNSNQTSNVAFDVSFERGSCWQLFANEPDNELVRDEFYYEGAPSGTLCLRILRFHSKPARCVQVIMEQLCEPLFNILASVDVDFGLLIDVIKSLLNGALSIITDSQMVAIPELHSKINCLFDRLDIIKMMVDDNCVDAELIRLIIKCDPESNKGLEQLQDRFIERERFELALRVAGKLNCNVKRLWKMWALLCLKNSQFTEARTKFRHCFQPDNATQNAKLLADIFDCLYSLQHYISRPNIRDTCRMIKSGQSHLLFVRPALQESSSVPEVLEQEAEFYLQKYGTKQDYLRFYTQFKLHTKAIQLLCTEPYSASLTTIFVHNLIIPAVDQGQLDKLLAQISQADPSLDKLYKHFIALCKYLTGQRLYSVLHQIQLFMGDFVRAAMSKVNHFFLSPPPSDYIQLFHRLEHIRQAKEHCRAYLDHQSSKPGKGCLHWSDEEVTRLIRTLNLQMDLTERFYENGISGTLPFNEREQEQKEQDEELHSAMQTGQQDESLDEIILEDEYDKISLNALPMQESGHKKPIPLTLLSSSKADQIDLAALVLVYGGNTTFESFSLAQQIIKEYNLDWSIVLRVAAKVLIYSKKVNIVKMLTELLDCIKATNIVSTSSPSQLCDEFVCVCIRHSSDTAMIEAMIKVLDSDLHKINCYLLIGKLKQAYLLAVKLGRTSDVHRVRSAAESTGQDAVRRICEMWLEKRNSSHEDSTNS